MTVQGTLLVIHARYIGKAIAFGDDQSYQCPMFRGKHDAQATFGEGDERIPDIIAGLEHRAFVTTVKNRSVAAERILAFLFWPLDEAGFFETLSSLAAICRSLYDVKVRDAATDITTIGRPRIAALLLVINLTASAGEVASVAASVKGTLFDQAATAVAKVSSNDAGLRSTIRNYTSATVFIPAIARGQVDFGVANQYEITLALTGQRYFEGRQQTNLRAVSVLFPLQIAMFVRDDSSFTRIGDLAGNRLPDGYVSARIIVPLLDAVLASDGLTRDDVRSLNVPGIVSSVDAFMSGRTDGFLMAIRAPKVREAHARLGIRALPIDNTPATLAAIRQHMPVAYLSLENPGPANPGVLVPTWVVTYDTLLFASTETGEELVYQMTRALHDNKQNLIKASPAFRRFDRREMAKDLGVLEYHSGAIRFYEEQGLWPPPNP
jgi:TRAP transporter TAXI family solute receptor